MIRPSRPEESARLRVIERAAGERFREVGFGDIADHDPASVETMTAYANAGRAFVAVDADDEPVGYVLVDVVDGNAHVEQLSVHPDHQGRGHAKALIDAAGDCLQDAPAITLTTFRDVPWNRPLYEHLGFRVLGDDEIGPELRAVVEHEVSYGLDPTIRVCMRRDQAGS